MEVAIHAEIDALFFLILFSIAYHSARNVSQQMSRVLFRYTVYGIMLSLALDTAWILIDGRTFPGAIILNNVINALLLPLGVVLGGVWYLYVLETLGYQISRRLMILLLTPGGVMLILNLLSMRTGWIFFVTEENVYVRGPFFIIQTGAALLMLLISLLHIVTRLINKKGNVSRTVVFKLLQFYIIPVVGTLAALPFTGMPGTWTCASVSIILIYIDDQDGEIMRDSLTGLNNRKTLPSVFSEYVRLAGPESRLYLFMMDLDNFKGINDTLGHPVGDQALTAAAMLFRQSVEGLRSVVARIGGDEFLIMGFFRDEEEAEAFRGRITDNFARYNQQARLPYDLSVSIGYSAHTPGQTLEDFMEAADEKLYLAKRGKKR